MVYIWGVDFYVFGGILLEIGLFRKDLAMRSFKDRMIVYTNRLHSLAQEQLDLGNMAMYYVLDDIHDGIDEAMSDERHKDDPAPKAD